VDEDSYGYVTAEGMLSQKPVLTCTDSGGILSLVLTDETGIVTEPTPIALAKGIDRFFQEPDLARRLGISALRTVRELDLDWATTIERLLA
jgi:glycosyltransferase involved in cell wall biosynthesis